MQDEEKTPDDLDDDFLDGDDDFDFDDIEDDAGNTGDLDDDDFGDDSWDDFDDIPDAEIQENNEPSKSEEKDDSAPAPKKAKGKSFVSKNFNVIVIAIAVLGGGGLFLAQMGGSSTEAPAPTIETDMTNGLPAEQTALPKVESNNGQVAEDIFKGPEELAAEAREQQKETLSVDIKEAPPMPSPMSQTPQKSPPVSSQAEVLTPMPGMASLSEQNQLASLSEPLEEEPAKEPEPAPEQEAEMVVKDTSQPPAPPVEPEIEPEAVIQDKPVLPVLDTPANSVSEEEFQEVHKKMEHLEKELAETNENMAVKISEKNNKISNLNDTISKLEARIAELNKPAAKPAAEKKPSPPAKTVQPTVKPNKTVSPAKSSVDTSNTWQLRSAQPGKALVSAKDSNDFRTVKVGDTLRGIGRIVSIGLENNKWVITGTKGRISQ